MLVSILEANIPKYFAPSDVRDFQRYLDRQQWTVNHVYVDDQDRPYGCAGYYLQEKGSIGLAWMLFLPGSVGSARIRKGLIEYLQEAARNVRPGENPRLKLNTIPRLARLLKRFGFEQTDVKQDGYAPGYDLISMQLEMPRQGVTRDTTRRAGDFVEVERKNNWGSQ